MKFAIVAEIAVVILAGVLLFASTANAEPSSRTCWSMANTVKSALAAHPNADRTAWDQYRAGTEACTKGYTAMGVSHLQAAMKALGN
jgi:hypothetical protein